MLQYRITTCSCLIGQWLARAAAAAGAGDDGGGREGATSRGPDPAGCIELTARALNLDVERDQKQQGQTGKYRDVVPEDSELLVVDNGDSLVPADPLIHYAALEPRNRAVFLYLLAT